MAWRPRRVEPLDLPAESGPAEVALTWEAVRRRPVAAGHPRLVTVGPDGRPHVVPVDGIWPDDACFFGGNAQTVEHRNLTHEPRAVLHLEDAADAVIVEATSAWLFSGC